MVVGGIVTGTMLCRSDCISEKHREDSVVTDIAFRLIEGFINGDGSVLIFRFASQNTGERCLLSRTKVLFMKLLFERRGVRNDLAHFPAVVTLVSCPSFAVKSLIIRSQISLASSIDRALRKLTHIWGDENPLRQLVI